MDKEKLDALRKKYGEAKGGDIFNPKFKKVAEKLFSGGDNRTLPYANPPTLLDAPYRPGAVENGNLDGIDVALVGVPTDIAVTNRTGARFGPRAMRALERIGPYNHVLNCIPSADLNVADTGDVPFRARFDQTSIIEDIETHYQKIVEAGAMPLTAGGDHSISYPILKAVGRDRPVGMIHIDAHADTAGEFDGSKFHHGGPFRLAVLDGVLDPERTIQIGIRGSAEFLWDFSYDSGMTLVHAEKFEEQGASAVAEMALSVVGDGPVYISFDIDSIDPGFAPGTGTPEVAGLTPRQVLDLLHGLKGVDVVGGDVVEVAPQYDATTNTAQVATQVMFELLCLIALRNKS